eukprot:4215268-Amphidinium_carterae.1
MAIDDLSESFVNASFEQVEKVDFHDVDFISNLLGVISDILRGKLEHIRLTNGTLVEVQVHKSWL